MSDEPSFESVSEQLHDIAADIEHAAQESEKQAADRRALETRRKIEAIREQKELERALADYTSDYDDY